MRITQQSSTSLPLGALAPARDAPRYEPAQWDSFRGPVQWLLEGPGWDVLRPAADFVLLCLAVVVSLGGAQATLDVPAARRRCWRCRRWMLACSACAGSTARACAR